MRLRLTAAAALTRKAVETTVAHAAGMLAHFERRDHVLRVLDGEAPSLGSDVAVFCHFDRSGQIREHTRRYIEALRSEGISVVVVSNSGAALREADEAWLRRQAARVVLRRNVGYDFGAWRDAMRVCGLPSPAVRRLLLLNDSVYGPFRPLADLLGRMDFEHADIWGPTDSWQLRYHLQSYFLAIGPRALASEKFRMFWAELPDVRSKLWVVRHCEVGFTQAMIRAGLRCRALWPYTELVDRVRTRLGSGDGEGGAELLTTDPFTLRIRANFERVLAAATQRRPVNPTADLWLPLLECGFPFIKRELLCRNPSRVPDVAAWRDAVHQLSPAGSEIVLQDLARSLSKVAP